MKTYDNFYREASTYDLILRRYKERGEQYSDPNFYPTFKVPETKFTFDPINHVWNRVDKFYKGSLYENISTNAIQQGCIGDCYFVSALARIASQKNLVEMLFDPRSDVKCGAVIVYLYAFGRRTPILIDTFLPYKRGTRVQIFSHPSDVKFSPWFCLVEKAYAKLCGSFSNIINGTFPRAIYSIFGYFPINKESSDIKGSVFEKLLKWQRKGAVVGTHISLVGTKATVNEIKDNGLVANHAYNVLKARVAEGKNFICLRNPWGDHHEWLGDWSDTSELWTESLKKTLGVEVGDNGTFWMIEKDFLYYFSCFQTALPLNPEWHFKSFQTTLMPGPHDGRQVFDPLAKIEERDQFAFKIDGETAAKVYIRIERRGSKKYKDSASFQLLLAEAGGRRITSTNNSTMITATVSLYSDITGFTFPMDNTICSWSIVLQRTQAIEDAEDVFVQLACQRNFTLYNINTPHNFLPEDEKTGILFDNSSKRHPNVAPALKVKSINGINVNVLSTWKGGSVEVFVEEEESENEEIIVAPITTHRRKNSAKKGPTVDDDDEITAATKAALWASIEEERRRLEQERRQIEEEKKRLNDEKRRRLAEEEEEERKKRKDEEMDEKYRKLEEAYLRRKAQRQQRKEELAKLDQKEGEQRRREDEERRRREYEERRRREYEERRRREYEERRRREYEERRRREEEEGRRREEEERRMKEDEERRMREEEERRRKETEDKGGKDEHAPPHLKKSKFKPVLVPMKK